jgi:hypothetical protein
MVEAHTKPPIRIVKGFFENEVILYAYGCTAPQESKLYEKKHNKFWKIFGDHVPIHVQKKSARIVDNHRIYVRSTIDD